MDHPNVRDSAAMSTYLRSRLGPSPAPFARKAWGRQKTRGGVLRRMEGGTNASASSRMSSRPLTALEAHLRPTCYSLVSTARRLLFLGETQRPTDPGGYLARLVFIRREA